MTKDDFFKLQIRQIIYFKGIKTSVFGKQENTSDDLTLSLLVRFGINSKGITYSKGDDEDWYDWDSICADCSLEAPKEKKRYWQWIIRRKKLNEPIFTTRMFDEDGFDVNGIKHSSWDDSEKKKVESVWWEE